MPDENLEAHNLGEAGQMASAEWGLRMALSESKRIQMYTDVGSTLLSHVCACSARSHARLCFQLPRCLSPRVVRVAEH